jgi:hypothetical protein
VDTNYRHARTPSNGVRNLVVAHRAGDDEG